MFLGEVRGSILTVLNNVEAVTVTCERKKNPLTEGGRLNIDDEPLSVKAFTYSPQNRLETIVLK